jgi:UDP-galactopyranose mutase
MILVCSKIHKLGLHFFMTSNQQLCEIFHINIFPVFINKCLKFCKNSKMLKLSFLYITLLLFLQMTILH